MTKRKAKPDITWDHCTRVNPKDRKRVKCNYCSKIMSGGVNRMKHHLAGTKQDIAQCVVADEKIKQLFLGILKVYEEKKARGEDDECFEVVSDEENTDVDGTLDSFVKKNANNNESGHQA